MTILRNLAITLVVLILAGAVLFVSFAKPASAESVCENFFHVSQEKYQAELGIETNREDVERMIDQTLEECTKKTDFWIRNSMKSGIEKANITKCQAKAADFEAFQSCRS